jgi:hypothetical protein
MGAPNGKPLLLLDVDGPLNPFAARQTLRPAGYNTHRMLPEGWLAREAARGKRARPIRVWLNPAHGPALMALPFELVWATAWTHGANQLIAGHVGLPRLPVITWPEMFQVDPDGVHWKTRHLVSWAAGRPFAWVDDEHTDADRAWVAANHAGPALLHYVDPGIGLTDDDFAALKVWAEGQR